MAGAIGRLPGSSLFIAHIDSEKVRKTSLFPALVSLLRARGWGKALAEQPRLCGFSLWSATRALAFGMGPDGPVVVAELAVPEQEALECVRKINRGSTPSVHGSAGPEKEGTRVNAFGQAFAAEQGLLFFGDSRAVRKAQDDAFEPSRVARFELSGNTVAVFRGDLGDLTLDGEVHASAAVIGGRMALKFASLDAASQIYDRVSKAQVRAQEAAERPLARDVLRSISLGLQGRTIELRFGTTGDIAVQERYLDVLLGLALAFLQDFESGPGAPAK
jgi:hypothetical protein